MCGVKEKKIITEGGVGEIVEKKARFICYVRPVKNEEEAGAFVDGIKKKHWDARHNCSAMVIGDNNEFSRCSDDGEPSGTAGRPMLDVLINEGYHDVAVVVTRYFGGVLLGTGGLLRAYQAAVKAGLEASKSAVRTKGKTVALTTNYNDYNKLNTYFIKNEIRIDGSEYSDTIKLNLILKSDAAERVMADITEMTCGRAVMEVLGEQDILI